MIDQNEQGPKHTTLAWVVLGTALLVIVTGAVAATLWILRWGAVTAGTDLVLMAGEPNQSLDLYLSNSTGTERTQLTSTKLDEAFATWSPDGERLAFVRAQLINDTTGEWSDQAGLYLLDLGQAPPTETLLLRAQESGLGIPTWSPDGMQVAFLAANPATRSGPHSGSQLVVADVETRQWQTTPLTVTVENLSRQVSWSPQGTELAFVASDGQNADQDAAWVFDLEDGSLERLAPKTSAVAWSPTENVIAYYDTEVSNAIQRVMADGSRIAPLENQGWVTALDWSPDGKRLAKIAAVGRNLFSVGVYDLETGGFVSSATHSQGMPQRLAWSADGTFISYIIIIVGNNSEPVTEVFVMDAQSGEALGFEKRHTLEWLASWRPNVP